MRQVIGKEIIKIEIRPFLQIAIFILQFNIYAVLQCDPSDHTVEKPPAPGRDANPELRVQKAGTLTEQTTTPHKNIRFTVHLLDDSSLKTATPPLRPPHLLYTKKLNLQENKIIFLLVPIANSNPLNSQLSHVFLCKKRPKR